MVLYCQRYGNLHDLFCIYLFEKDSLGATTRSTSRLRKRRHFGQVVGCAMGMPLLSVAEAEKHVR